ncbi:MAG: N-acetylglucosamine-6-phosphate deacetylase, partial [Egibacteraceae bacterium]
VSRTGRNLAPGDFRVAGGPSVWLGCAPPGAQGLVAAAGLVDIHMHGSAGVDFAAANAEALATAGTGLLAAGTTAYQASLITAPEDELIAALGRLQRAPAHPRLIGAHLEGPFLSPEKLGTHSAKHRRDPDLSLARRLLDAGDVTMVTLAPELPGAHELISLFHDRDVLISLGHSDATAEEAHAGFDAGGRAATHVFNAMRPLHHRDPGIAGVALARSDVTVELIVDGHHLHPDTVRLAWHAAAGRVALVTDGIAAAGLGDGTYRLGDVEVTVRDGAARNPAGALAGSTLTMLQAVRNLHALGVPLPEAVDAATGVPARLVGREDLGLLVAGTVADIIVLDDRLELQACLVDGEQT